MGEVQKWVFTGMLVIAAVQDWRSRSVSGTLLLPAFVIGIFANVAEKRSLFDTMLSCMVGVSVFLGGKLTGGIGDGDGLFLIVSGLYLRWKDNLLLLMGGLYLSFLLSLPLTVYGMIKKEKKKSLPFLTILAPVGIWIVMGGGSVL